MRLQDHAPAQWNPPIALSSASPIPSRRESSFPDPKSPPTEPPHAIPPQFLRSFPSEVATRWADDNEYKNYAKPAEARRRDLASSALGMGHGGDESNLGPVALAPSDPHDAPATDSSTLDVSKPTSLPLVIKPPVPSLCTCTPHFLSRQG